jgi:hypothetical protein
MDEMDVDGADVRAVMELLHSRGLNTGQAAAVMVATLWKLFQMNNIGVDDAAKEIDAAYRSMCGGGKFFQ